MKKHKCNIFPAMSDEDFGVLKDDIQTNGYDDKYPVILCNDDILDGWHRYKACDELGIEYTYEEFDGSDEDALNFVMRSNKRRNLDSGQWAGIKVLYREFVDIFKEMAKEKQVEGLKKGNILPVVEKIPPRENDKPNKKTRDKIAELPGGKTNPRYVGDMEKYYQDDKDTFDDIVDGKITISEANKQKKADKRLAERAKMAEAGKKIKPSDRYNVWKADINTWKAPRQYDWIITDPPYPREFIPLYVKLAERASEWLKPGGLLIAMAGQSYLDQIYEIMSKHLQYYWTASYLTPGQPTPLRQINVNTTWKPLLIFRRKDGEYDGKIFGDVFQSSGNDKSHHMWGQSVGGMYDIISKMCLKGQYILDPFCGAGTTGIATLMHECLFDGIELDQDNVNISIKRISETNDN